MAGLDVGGETRRVKVPAASIVHRPAGSHQGTSLGDIMIGMSELPDAPADLDRFLGEDCTECGTPGFWRHLSAVFGCGTCATNDPQPVYVPIIPMQNKRILAYDMVLPKWPEGPPWAPFRNRLPRASRCYRLASGAPVHIKPDCRC